MQDGIILGTGNSRFLKSVANFLALYPTYEDFAAALVAGTLPIDLNGINEAGWQQLATLLAKATLFSDPTAAKYFASPTGTETVDQVLSLLGRFQRGMGNEYVWSKTKSEIVYQLVGTNYTGTNPIDFTGSNYLQKTYGTGIAIDNTTGVISLTGVFVPSNVPGSDNQSYWDGLVPFYMLSDGYYYKVTGLSDYYYNHCATSSYIRYSVGTGTKITNYGYVNSPDSDAYPPAEPDGFTYTALGQIGNKVQIATGSYPGSGLYGSSHPNSLTFDFPVKIIVITYMHDTSSNYYIGHTFQNNIIDMTVCPTTYTSKFGFAYGSSYSYGYGKKSADGKTFYWYNTESATEQLNYSGYTYYYFAIG